MHGAQYRHEHRGPALRDRTACARPRWSRARKRPCVSLLAEFTRATGIPVKHAFVLADAHQASLGLHETVLYRALQEALANIARHAQATQVHVRLQCQGALLHCSIADNGIGMRDVTARTGCGLAGMEERLQEAPAACCASPAGPAAAPPCSCRCLLAGHGAAPARMA